MTRTEELSPPAVDRLLTVLTVVAVVVGIALRFAPRSSLWLDEALTVNIASLPLGEIGDALRRDGHPPLFYFLLHLWTAVGGSSDWWVRSLAGVISVASLPLAYLAGRRVAERVGAGPLGVRRTGLITLAVMAMMPYGIRYGAETRMYSLAITLVTAGYLLSEDLLTARSAGRRRIVVAVGVALVSGALLWSHYWSMWLLAPVGLLAIFVAVRASDPRRRTGARLLIGGLVGGGVLFLPWVPTLLFQTSRTGTPWGEVFGPVEVATITIQDFSGDALTSYVAVAFILLAVVGLAISVRSSKQPGHQLVVLSGIQMRVAVELAVLLSCIALGWAMAVASGNTYSSRYGAVVFPLFVLCIGAGIAVLRRPMATVGALSVLLVLSSYVAVSTLMQDRSQAGEIGDRIASELAEIPGDEPSAVVISCPDQIGVALQRSLDARDVPLEVVPFPAAGDPRFIDWVDYAERNEAADPQEFVERLTRDLPADATVFVVAMPGYKTFETQCEQVIGQAGAGRDLTSLVEPGEPGTTGEPMGLWVFSPPA